jgi:hypothetical protein
MSKFIEFVLDDGDVLHVQTDDIISVLDQQESQARIGCRDGEFYFLKESPAEIMQKIRAAEGERDAKIDFAAKLMLNAVRAFAKNDL